MRKKPSRPAPVLDQETGMGVSKGQVPTKKPRPLARQKQKVENGTTGSQKSKKSSLKNLTSLLRKKDSDKRKENTYEDEKFQDNLAVVRPIGNVELQERKTEEQNIDQQENTVVYDVPKPLKTAIVSGSIKSEESAHYVKVDENRGSNSVNTHDYLDDTNNNEVIPEESRASSPLYPDSNTDANEQNKNNELVEEDRQETVDDKDENKDEKENEEEYENSREEELLDDEKEENKDEKDEENRHEEMVDDEIEGAKGNKDMEEEDGDENTKGEEDVEKEEKNKQQESVDDEKEGARKTTDKEEEDAEENTKGEEDEEEEEEEEGEGEDSRELPEEWGVKPTRRSIILPENYPDVPQTRTSIV